MKDQEIIELYWQRNENAISESQAQYGNYCMGVSLNILNSRPDAEECVNDTWVRAWNSMPPHKPNCLRTFLGKITRNLSLDRLRTMHRQKRNTDLMIAMDELGDSIPCPDDIEESVLCGLLDEFLGGMDPENRKLFVGRYWYGRSVKTLARHYGLTANAVSLRLARSRNALRSFLTERGYRA